MAKTKAVVPTVKASEPVQTLGEAYDEQVVGQLESDMRYCMSSRAMAQAMARMKKIKADCERLCSQIEQDHSPEEAGLAILFVESCRPELARLYMSVNHSAASTVDGQAKIAALADNIIDRYIHRLQGNSSPLLQAADGPL